MANSVADDSPATQIPSNSGSEPSWRQGERRTSSLGRRFRLSLALLISATFLVILVLVLVQPFQHPRTHLFLLTDEDGRPATSANILFAPVQNFVVEDHRAFETLAPLLYQDKNQRGPVSLNVVKTAGIHTLGETLAQRNVGPEDNLILYVRAEGSVDADQAYLDWTFDPERRPVGRIRLRDLFTQLAEFHAAEKVVILDAGQITHDPRLGMVVNWFPQLLREEVERTGDPHLWVLNSHQMLERSHRSLSKEQSILGMYVARGLRGEADLNSDRTIDLGELYRYTSASVQMHVRETSGGNDSQTPKLLWGGSKSRSLSAVSNWPILVAVVDSFPTAVSNGDKETEDSKKPSRKAQFEKAARLAPIHPVSLDNSTSIHTPTRPVTPSLPITPSLSPSPIAFQAPVTPSVGMLTARVEQSAVDRVRQSNQPKAADPKTSDDAPPNPPASVAKNGVAQNGATTEAQGESRDRAADSEPIPDSVPALFSKVWELRDRLARHESTVPRPLDFAPHLWRTFEEQLLAYERLYLAGRIGDQAVISTALAQWVLSLERLADGRTDLPPKAPAIVRRMIALMPQNPLPDERVFSLGMVELRYRLQGRPLPNDIQDVIQAFDQFTTDGTSAEYGEWLDALPAVYHRYLEIRLAHRLLAVVDGEWRLAQLALKTRRRSEQVATQQLWGQIWIEQRMARADSARLEGERELLDQASRGWRQRAEGKLRDALTEYEAAGQSVKVVHAARMNRNDLLHRLPWYVRWWHAAGDYSGPSSVAPGANQLLTLMDLLSRQSELLEFPAAEDLVELARLHLQLERLQQQIEAPLQEEFVTGLVEGQAAEGDGWRIDVLLQTPLPRRETRMQLLRASWSVDEQLVAQLPRLYIPQSLSESATYLSQTEWQRLKLRSELDARLAELAALHPSDDSGATERVRTSFSVLTSRQTTMEKNGATESHRRQLRDAYSELGGVLRDFYSTLPGRIGAAYRHNQNLSDEAMRVMCLCALRATDRATRLIDPRDVRKTGDFDPIRLLRKAQAADLLAWQRRRLIDSRNDADFDEARFLTTAAQVYRNELSGLPRSAPAVVSASPLELTVVSQVALPANGVEELSLDVRWNGLRATDVWLVLKYDSKLMNVSGHPDTPFYEERQLQKLGRPYPFRPDLDATPRTLHLQPGQSVTARLRIQALTLADEPARFIVKAIADDTHLRRGVEVLLPFPERYRLHVGGPRGSWTTTPGGLILHPFPNQKTNYRLRLSSDDKQSRTVDVELAALQQASSVRLPRVALSPDDADRWLARLGPITPLTKVSNLTIPANAEPLTIPFPVNGGGQPKATPPPATEPIPMSADNEEGKSGGDQTSAGPLAVSIPHGLLMSVTDLASGRKTLKRIMLAPQRPRRYIRPRVGYNLDRERIEVSVGMRDSSMFSPNGVGVQCELADGLRPEWTAQLAGRLRKPDDEIQLFVAVPEQAGRIVTLRIHIDGYPRAFVFQVPCDTDSDNLPEETALHGIRLVAPEDRSAFPAPTAAVPVVFQVDAPHGTFQTGEDFVQVGIDDNRDRTFRGESPLLFHNDRQVELSWVGTAAGGAIMVATAIDDFHVKVPTSGLRNARVNLLGRLVTPTKTSWSLPRQLVFDGVGPKLTRPQLDFGDATIGNLVTRGKDATVSVLADDFARSGLFKVEAAFDVAGSGKFSPDSPPVSAKRGKENRWTAQLGTGDLKPGTYAVLFRGTDRVGNVGDYVSITVRIVSPEDAEKRKSSRTNQLTGVILDGKKPAPGIRVTLTPQLTDEEKQKLKAEKKQPISIPPTTTDAEGKFFFPKVQVGDYQITIAGITRGLRRKQETTISIPPPPARIKPLRLRIDRPPGK